MCVSLAVRQELDFHKIWYFSISWKQLPDDEALRVGTERLVEDADEDRRSFCLGES